MEYEQGAVIVPSYLSKGIEFDAVIVYDASDPVYGEESLRRTFYKPGIPCSFGDDQAYKYLSS